MDKRFELIKEPTNNWSVWDMVLDRPAELAGTPLIGLPMIRAESICELLNGIHRRNARNKRLAGSQTSLVYSRSA